MFPGHNSKSSAKSPGIAWTVAGSDSSGGAGIQADLKTMNSFSVCGASVITALTAQNTRGVSLIEPVSPTMLANQISQLKNDLHPRAVKTGMLYDACTVKTVMRELAHLDTFLVVDPVLIATSGDSLASLECLENLRKVALPQADLITPNLPEAWTLAGMAPMLEPEIGTDEVEELALRLLDMGAKAVFLKGGHAAGPYSQDFFLDRNERFWLTSPRHPGGAVHGSGCTLSAAITAAMALGCELKEALVVAKAYINQCWRTKPNVGQGNSPLSAPPVALEQMDMPLFTRTAAEGVSTKKFEREENLGFYPIVACAEKLPDLLAAGVTTIQLRIKDQPEDQIENQIRKAVAISKNKSRLYINDHWRHAIAAGAYGVHLGQEDLDSADIDAIRAAGLKLGVSTHCHWEVARAFSAQPSYIAIGPVHDTTTKVMKFAPLGADGFAYYQRLVSDYPTAAIGGICLDNAPELLEKGATGLAVVRAISEAPDPQGAARDWMKLIPAKHQRAIQINLPRYSQQLGVKDIGVKGQQKLFAANILIVGAGGLGCPVGLYLAGAGVGRITVMDADTVELSNLHRQIAFRTDDLGRPKAICLTRQMNELNKDIEVCAVVESLSAENAHSYIKNVDLVLDCTDNFATRFLIADTCFTANVPLIQGAVSGQRVQISGFSNATPCLRCVFPSQPGVCVSNCAEGGILGPVPGLCAMIMTQETLMYLTQNRSSIFGKMFTYDCAEQTGKFLQLVKDRNCLHCATKNSTGVAVKQTDNRTDAASSSSLKHSKSPADSTRRKRSGDYTISLQNQIDMEICTPKLAPEEFEIALSKSAHPLLIDVRNAVEYGKETLPNAINIQIEVLSESLADIPVNTDVFVFCQSGIRSSIAAEVLRDQLNLFSTELDGGFNAWLQSRKTAPHTRQNDTADSARHVGIQTESKNLALEQM